MVVHPPEKVWEPRFVTTSIFNKSHSVVNVGNPLVGFAKIPLEILLFLTRVLFSVEYPPSPVHALPGSSPIHPKIST